MTSYLNTENIVRSKDGIEYHPLRPFLPENATAKAVVHGFLLSKLHQ